MTVTIEKLPIVSRFVLPSVIVYGKTVKSLGDLTLLFFLLALGVFT